MQLSMTLAIFQGHSTVSRQISRKRCVIRQTLLYTNRKSYTGFRLLPLLMTLNDIWRLFHLLTSNIWEIILDTSTKTKIANKKSNVSFQMIRMSMTLAIFQGHYTVAHQISRKRCVIRQKLLQIWFVIGNDTLAFDWCHFWWPWSTFEGHFSLSCHFHVNFSNRRSTGFHVARSLNNS